jgi:hypothetical protein
LARALIQQGKKEEAMEQYEEAVKLMKAEPKYPLGQKKQP